MRRGSRNDPRQMSLFSSRDASEPARSVPPVEVTPLMGTAEDADVPYADFETIVSNTDFIDEYQPLIAWFFDTEDVDAVTGGSWGRLLLEPLMAGLRELSESASKCLRESAFTILLGEYENQWGYSYYHIGVPPNTHQGVLELLTGRLNSVPGYWGLEDLPEGAVRTPVFRYEQGRAIAYSEPEVAGSEYLDDDAWYGSGLTVLRRNWRPASLLGRELYGEPDTSGVGWAAW